MGPGNTPEAVLAPAAVPSTAQITSGFHAAAIDGQFKLIGVSKERAAEITSKILEFRETLPDFTKPDFFKTLDSVSDFVDQIVARGAKITDEIEAFEMIYYAEKAARYISWNVLFENGNYSPLAQEVKDCGTEPSDYFNSLAHKLDRGIREESKQKSLCESLKSKLNKIPLDTCVEYAQVLECSRLQDFSTFRIHWLSGYGMESLAVKNAGTASDEQVLSVQKYLGVAFKMLDPRYLACCQNRSRFESAESDYEGMLLPFAKEEKLRWIWKDVRLEETVTPIRAKAEQDYQRDRMISGNMHSNASFIVIWSDGDPNQTNIKERLKAGDYLPLMGIGFSWTKKLDQESLDLVIHAARRATREAADIIFAPNSRYCEPYKNSIPSFEPGKKDEKYKKRIFSSDFRMESSPENQRASNLVNNLERIFTRNGWDNRGAPINQGFLKSADVGAILLWHLMTEFWADKDNPWLQQCHQRVDSFQPGVGCAIKMLQESYNAADIISLFRSANSYSEAAKLGADLMAAKYDQNIKKALLTKVRTGALTPAELHQLLKDGYPLEVKDIMKLGKKV